MPQLNNHQIRDHLPHPISAGWLRVALAKNEAEQIDCLLACSEVLFRTLAAFLLPDYLRGAPDEKVEAAIAKFSRPTDGIWLDIIRTLIDHLGRRTDPPPFMPEVRDWYFGRKTRASRLLNEITALRNEVSHRRGGPPARMQERLLKLRGAVRSALAGVEWMTGYRPFRVVTATPTGRSSFAGKIQFLIGNAEQTAPLVGQWDSGLYLDPNSVYLANPAGDQVLELSPFFEFLPDPQSKQEHLFVMKEAPGLKQLVLTHDGSGAEIRGPVRRRDQHFGFDDWLAARKSFEFHFRITNSNGVFCARLARAVEEGPDLGPGFKVLGELGRGGMAVVYRVRNPLGDEFALKVLNSDLAANGDDIERFIREARTMREAEHPRIVKVLDVGALPGGQRFIKMPIMNGSLQDRLSRRGEYSEASIRSWAEQALEALVQVHASGIIHRDVKPSNLLFDAEGKVVLTDFGIAYWTNQERITRTSEPIGTVAYMPPEQRNSKTVTEKADIYSLGVVLHELVTGELPENNPGIDIEGELGELIRAMGASSASARPSAADALMTLRALSATIPIAKPHPVAPPVVEKVPRKTPPRKPTTGKKKRTTTSRRVQELQLLRKQQEEEHQQLELLKKQQEEEQQRQLDLLKKQQEEEQLARQKAAEEAARQAAALRESQRLATINAGKRAAGVILVALFAINFIETWAETTLRSAASSVIKTEGFLAESAHWFEWRLDFTQHDATRILGSHGYSVVYFFVFPLLIIAAVAVFARRRDATLLVLAIAAAIDYVIALPFYLFFPVPERWAYPGANAILLSDLWTSRLIQAFRPFSGLNNCFPSFHVSATVIVILCLYRARMPFRAATVPIGLAVILSTFAMGIHWLPDIITGIAAGVLSVWGAEKLLPKLAPGQAAAGAGGA